MGEAADHIQAAAGDAVFQNHGSDGGHPALKNDRAHAVGHRAARADRG